MSDTHSDLVMQLVQHVLQRAAAGDSLPDEPHLREVKKELVDKLDEILSSLQTGVSVEPSAHDNQQTIANSCPGPVLGLSTTHPDPSDDALLLPHISSFDADSLSLSEENSKSGQMSMNTNDEGGEQTISALPKPPYIASDGSRATGSATGLNEPEWLDPQLHFAHYTGAEAHPRNSSAHYLPISSHTDPGLRSAWTHSPGAFSEPRIHPSLEHGNTISGSRQTRHPYHASQTSGSPVLRSAPSQSAPRAVQSISPWITPSLPATSTATHPRRDPLAEGVNANVASYAPPAAGPSSLKRKRTEEGSATDTRCTLPGCDKPSFEFASKRELKKHQKCAKAHRTTQPLCPLCGKDLSRSDAVARHLRDVHGLVLEDDE